ncbi:MAG: Beta-ketoacyl-acyl-carrier-protein synthase [Verrucomicrobia bacterium]|nr:Beta-ketoacyl-acyl-carrier-protein synthase [Verrucomicrobiota bacterium]
MSIIATGWGAVSPAGWTAAELSAVMVKGEALPVEEFVRQGTTKTLRARKVPKPAARQAYLAHPRLRRTSPISSFAMSAALEAIGADRALIEKGELRLGVVFCVMSGCVNYSRRFYDEVLREPATASPLVFPETVFNAPASHLAALLGATGINYTLVGDPGMFLQGLAQAAQWLQRGQVDACVVVSAEESDWLTVEASALFEPDVVVSEGAGAIYLKNGDAGSVALEAVTDGFSFNDRASRTLAATQMQTELSQTGSADWLCDSRTGSVKEDFAESEAWSSAMMPRWSVKKVLGESFAAASAWQCVLACERLASGAAKSAAHVSVVGCNQQAIGARWVKA